MIADLPRHIELASARGYGTSDLLKINIDGKLEVISGFKLPQDRDLGLNKVINSRTVLRPIIDKELCNSCRNCIDHCPNRALKMDEYPVVDPELCIICFCCQELCPQKAIELK